LKNKQTSEHKSISVSEKQWTIPVQGTCQCIHPWGRTALVNAKSVTLTLRDNHLRLDTLIEQPVLDGSQRKGYFFPQIEGDIEKFEGTIRLVDADSTFIINNKEIQTTRTAKILVENGEATSVMVVHEDRAMFDIPEHIQFLKEMDAEWEVLIEREIEYLQTFKDGVRRFTFYGGEMYEEMQER
jgi:hypothetical protein